MRVYLDICCLKRPFDDQSQRRIHLEAEAVLSIIGSSDVDPITSVAHHLENDQNPVAQRAARVREWLRRGPVAHQADHAEVTRRTAELIRLGFRNFDAFHLASAEAAGAEVVATCDDRLLAAAQRHADVLIVRVVNPLVLAEELFL